MYDALAITVPVLVGVRVAKQLEVVAFTVVKLHGEPVNEPPEMPVLVNATVPPGVDAVPVAVSLTVAVQVVACPTRTEAGEHTTVVVVDLPPETVTVLLVPLLPLWAVSVAATV